MKDIVYVSAGGPFHSDPFDTRPFHSDHSTTPFNLLMTVRSRRCLLAEVISQIDIKKCHNGNHSFNTFKVSEQKQVVSLWYFSFWQPSRYKQNIKNFYLSRTILAGMYFLIPHSCRVGVMVLLKSRAGFTIWPIGPAGLKSAANWNWSSRPPRQKWKTLNRETLRKIQHFSCRIDFRTLNHVV